MRHVIRLVAADEEGELQITASFTPRASLFREEQIERRKRVENAIHEMLRSLRFDASGIRFK